MEVDAVSLGDGGELGGARLRFVRAAYSKSGRPNGGTSSPVNATAIWVCLVKDSPPSGVP